MLKTVEITQAEIKFAYENALAYTSQFTDYGKLLLNACFQYAIETGADNPHKVVVAGRDAISQGLQNMGSLAPNDGVEIVQRIKIDHLSDPGAHFYAMVLLLGRSPDQAVTDCLAEISDATERYGK